MSVTESDERAARSRPRLGALVLVPLLLLAASAGTYLMTRGGESTATAASAAASAAPTDDLTTFTDEAEGFRISYPKAWQRTEIPGGLILQISEQNAVSLKKITLEQPIDTANIDDIRAVTDAVLSRPEAHLTVLKSEATTVGGLPGIYYLYTFPAEGPSEGPSEGVTGAHTHYFFFDGREMYTLVFQALPAAEFEALAPTFDKVVGSFGLLPN